MRTIAYHRFVAAVLGTAVLGSTALAAVTPPSGYIYTTELLMNSYLQWCAENRPFDRKTLTQLGSFFSDIYQPSRPRSDHPEYEVESIERGRTRVVTAIGIGRHQQFISESVPLDELAIVVKDHPHGYQVGELEAARTKYADKRKGIDFPWNVPPARDPGPGA